MSLKKINFIFENCESFEINEKYILFFTLDKIYPSIHYYGKGRFKKTEHADIFIIRLHSDANEEYHSFGIPTLAKNKFKRITEYNDLTSVKLTTDEGEKEYYLNWNMSNDCVNSYQKTLLTKNGDVCIVVAKDKELEDYFYGECFGC